MSARVSRRSTLGLSTCGEVFILPTAPQSTAKVSDPQQRPLSHRREPTSPPRPTLRRSRTRRPTPPPQRRRRPTGRFPKAARVQPRRNVRRASASMTCAAILPVRVRRSDATCPVSAAHARVRQLLPIGQPSNREPAGTSGRAGRDSRSDRPPLSTVTVVIPSR